MKNQALSKRKLNQGIMQFALITLAIALIGGYFGYNNYSEYQKAQTAFAGETQTLTDLKGSAEQKKQDYLALKKDLDTQNVTVNQAIEKILPSSEDFTTLARELDKYFQDTAATTNPMFLSSLSFNTPVISDTDELAKLPFSMGMSGNEPGLKDFLKYVENSGDLDSKTRLLSVNNMTLTFQDSEASPTATGATGETAPAVTPAYAETARNVTANISLNAYYQKPVTDNTNGQ